MASRKRERLYEESVRLPLTSQMKQELEAMAAEGNTSLVEAARRCIRCGLEATCARNETEADTARRIARAVGQDFAEGYWLDPRYHPPPSRTTCGEHAFAVRECQRLGLSDVVVVLRQADRLLVGEKVLNEKSEDKDLLEDEFWKESFDEMGKEDRERVEEILRITQVVLAAFHAPYRIESERVHLAKERLRKAYIQECADSEIGDREEGSMRKT